MAPDLLLAFFNSSGFVFELLFSIALFTSQVRRRRYFAVKALLCVIVMVAVAIMWDIAVPDASWAAVARCLVFYLCFYAGIRICLYSDLRKTLLYLVAGFLYRARCRGQTVTGPIFQCYLCSSIDSVFYLCIFSVCAQDTEDAF